MIHASAIISPLAKLGKNITIGPFSIIHDNVTIEDNTQIDAYCEIGYPTTLANEQILVIDKNSLIRSHTVIYAGSRFGEGLQTGHRVTIRENTIAGLGLRVGTSSDIQGDVVIGDYVRMHSNVFVAKGAEIGNFVWLFPYVVLTNDPHPPSDTCQGVIVEEYAAVGARSTILPGIIIGKHALVAAHSCVTRDVPAESVVRGVPAKPVSKTATIELTDCPGQSAYPWPRHFHRGYPKDVIESWQRDFG